MAVSPEGSTVFVSGRSEGGTSGYDYATIAYDAATGGVMWARRYNGPGSGSDSAHSVTVSPDGSTVFVTGGSLGAVSHYDYATIAYDAATGGVRWLRRYDGLQHGDDLAQSAATSPDGSTLFVHGESGGMGTFNSDFATIAYDAATGAVRWFRRYDGPGHRSELAESVAVSSDGSTVVVTGSSPSETPYFDYATIAYDAASGAVRWVRRYDGPANRNDYAQSAIVSPDGSTVFVTGTSDGGTSNDDYATIAYRA
jgi:WD40 repeat protein